MCRDVNNTVNHTVLKTNSQQGEWGMRTMCMCAWVVCHIFIMHMHGSIVYHKYVSFSCISYLWYTNEPRMCIIPIPHSSSDSSVISFYNLYCIGPLYFTSLKMATWLVETFRMSLCVLTAFNPLNTELNHICHLLALLGAHHIFYVSRVRVNTPCVFCWHYYYTYLINAQIMVHINLAGYHLKEMYSNK